VVHEAHFTVSRLGNLEDTGKYCRLLVRFSAAGRFLFSSAKERIQQQSLTQPACDVRLTGVAGRGCHPSLARSLNRRNPPTITWIEQESVPPTGFQFGRARLGRPRCFGVAKFPRTFGVRLDMRTKPGRSSLASDASSAREAMTPRCAGDPAASAFPLTWRTNHHDSHRSGKPTKEA
jgi:hypothetical protein